MEAGTLPIATFASSIAAAAWRSSFAACFRIAFSMTGDGAATAAAAGLRRGTGGGGGLLDVAESGLDACRGGR